MPQDLDGGGQFFRRFRAGSSHGVTHGGFLLEGVDWTLKWLRKTVDLAVIIVAPTRFHLEPEHLPAGDLSISDPPGGCLCRTANGAQAADKGINAGDVR